MFGPPATGITMFAGRLQPTTTHERILGQAACVRVSFNHRFVTLGCASRTPHKPTTQSLIATTPICGAWAVDSVVRFTPIFVPVA